MWNPAPAVEVGVIPQPGADCQKRFMCGSGGGNARLTEGRGHGILIRTAHLLRNTVNRVVTLSLVTNGARDRNVRRRARNHLAVLVHVGHSDLDRGVVLGLHKAARGSALAGHVKIDKLTLFCVSTTFIARVLFTYVFVLHVGSGRAVGGGRSASRRRRPLADLVTCLHIVVSTSDLGLRHGVSAAARGRPSPPHEPSPRRDRAFSGRAFRIAGTVRIMTDVRIYVHLIQ